MATGFTYRHYIHKDHLGSWTTITDEDGEIEQELSFDAWGNFRNPYTWTGANTTRPMFDRGFTGHEHLYDFGLINMNGRMYDPVMSSFLSVDNYVQSPENSQNFNRYAYCLNNPLKYTDPSGEFIVIDSWLVGFVHGFFSTGSDRFETAWNTANKLAQNDLKIWGGLFVTDPNKNFLGKSWELISRHTWQSLQTGVGFMFSQVSNIGLQVDEVDYYGGATVLGGNFYGRTGEAVTIGNYINGWKNIAPDPDNHLFQHEYGHYIQSQGMGPAYLFRVGIPSLLSNGEHGHDFHPVEQDANRRAFLYFNKHVDGFYKSYDERDERRGWNFRNNPLNIDNSFQRNQYVDYYDNNFLKQLNRLAVHAKWYDYASWLSPTLVFNPISVGIWNALYYNQNY